MNHTRRSFLLSIPPLFVTLSSFARSQQKQPIIMTVRGPISAEQIGTTLVHEHILVDFIGAKLINNERWNRDEVMDKVLPYLDQLKLAGCKTLVDCTPNYLGRDVILLEKLAATTGLHIITNTGYYGGSDEKFLPDHAFTESADALANRWINEFKSGIDKTRVKPGFIKTSVNPGPLTDISKKLIRAAALTHIKTGLTIASHTGPAVPAMEQIEILKKANVNPSAFIWVHAQNESDRSNYVRAKKEGAWISLDGLRADNISTYADHVQFFKTENCLDRLLLSHDAGWYEPGKAGGGAFRPYTVLFEKLIPELKSRGISEQEIKQITQSNPKNALTIGVRRLRK